MDKENVIYIFIYIIEYLYIVIIEYNYIYIIEYCSAIKNLVICDNMDEPRVRYAKGSKSTRKNEYCMIPFICGIYKS